MRPLFLATGPSFKKGFYHNETFPNIDIFPLMAFLLGLPSRELPNNGSLARVINMIDVNHFESFNNEKQITRKYWFGFVWFLCTLTSEPFLKLTKPKLTLTNIPSPTPRAYLSILKIICIICNLFRTLIWDKPYQILRNINRYCFYFSILSQFITIWQALIFLSLNVR